MARSVAFYLAHFDEEAKIVPEDVVPFPLALDEPIEQSEEELTPIISDEMRQALIDEGRACVRAEYEELIERERAALVAQLESERQRWVREEAGRLAEQFRATLDEFSAHLGNEVERILEPFVIREVREQMLSSLLERIRILLTDREKPILHLSGPMDLLEALCSQLNADDLTTCIDEVGGVDVKARLDSTSIQTRLSEWLEQLRDGE